MKLQSTWDPSPATAPVLPKQTLEQTHCDASSDCIVCEPCQWIWRGGLLCRPVMDDTHLFQRDKALRHYAVEYRKEGLNFFQAVDDLDNHRQVFGKPQDLRRMHNAMPAVPHHAAQNRRAGESGFSGFRNNRFIQENMPVFVGFADKNSQQITLFRNFHETHIAREIE